MATARNAAIIELEKRRRARESLVAYSRSITIPGVPISDDQNCWVLQPSVETGIAAHHALTMEAIERCILKPYGRLMIFEPPGSAKSTYASVVAPTWAMGKFPDYQVLMASYAATPIERHSKRGRQIVASPEYKAIWETQLLDGSKSANDWELKNGSRLYATGLQGAVTYTRCNLGIIDDPVAGRSEAQSETIRKTTLEAYEDEFLSRLIPGASVILIQTRWDISDLAGSILPDDWNGESGMIKCRDGQIWEVLCLPAQCESDNDPLGRKVGEYLWPEWFTQKHWDIYKPNTRTWESLYQQRPRPLQGSFFMENNLLCCDEPTGTFLPLANPKRYHTVYAVIDTAFKTGKSNDGVGVVYFAKSPVFDPTIAILDWDLKQLEGALLETWLPTVFQRLEDLAKEIEALLGNAGTWIEDKASGIVLLQQAQKKSWNVHPIDSKLTAMGKSERAVNISGYVHAGHVKITKQAYDRRVTYKGSTRNHLMSQILNFSPDTKDMIDDDLLDCFSYGCAIGLGNDEGF